MNTEIQDLVKNLEKLCREKDIHYSFFYSDRPHSITGCTTFSIEEFAILTEIVSRRLTMKEIEFLQRIIEAVIEERTANNDQLSN